MICAKCGKLLFRSSRKGIAEKLILPRIDVFPFRCRLCALRLYARGRNLPGHVTGVRALIMKHLEKYGMLAQQTQIIVGGTNGDLVPDDCIELRSSAAQVFSTR